MSSDPGICAGTFLGTGVIKQITRTHHMYFDLLIHPFDILYWQGLKGSQSRKIKSEIVLI
jgi:hypothetical protein